MMDKKIVETTGGYFKDHLIELVREHAAVGQRLRLAVRYPAGAIGVVDWVDIEGVLYAPVKVSPETQMLLGLPDEIGQAYLSSNDVFARVKAYVEQYFLLDEPGFAASLLASYVMMTYIHDTLAEVPYLAVTGAMGTGKTTLLERVGGLCYRSFNATACNPNTVLRIISEFHPTAMFDEPDMEAEDAGELARILNRGAMKGLMVWRREDEGDKFDVNAYSVFGPKLIAARVLPSEWSNLSIEVKLSAKGLLAGLTTDVSPRVTDEMAEEMRSVRRMLLTWRMNYWRRGELETFDSLYHSDWSGAVNGLFAPLMSIGIDSADKGFVYALEAMMAYWRGSLAGGVALA